MGQMALEMLAVVGQLGIETVNARWIMCHLEPSIFTHCYLVEQKH